MVNKKITMQDIAESLGISKNSVSRALSEKPGVSDETRKEVFEMADKLGYAYKPSKINNSEAMNIVLIASDRDFSKSYFFGSIYLSVQKELKKQGIDLQLESVSEKAANDLLLPDSILDDSVQGILILSHITIDYINKVIATGIPTVLLDHHHPSIHADAVLTENRYGAYRAVDHLINKNHKNIGFIGNTPYSPSYYERYLGYQMALEDHQLPINKEYILKDAPNDVEIITNFFDQIDNMPTAWFCTNDKLGYIILENLKRRGYDVPKDISVFSFDNGQLSKLSSPKITTMDINLQTFGKRGVELLLWRMNHPDEPIQDILIHPEIIERESVTDCPD